MTVVRNVRNCSMYLMEVRVTVKRFKPLSIYSLLGMYHTVICLMKLYFMVVIYRAPYLEV